MNVLQNLRHSVGGILQLIIAFGIPTVVILSGQLSLVAANTAAQQVLDMSLFGAPITLNVAYVGPALQVLMIGCFVWLACAPVLSVRSTQIVNTEGRVLSGRGHFGALNTHAAGCRKYIWAAGRGCAW